MYKLLKLFNQTDYEVTGITKNVLSLFADAGANPKFIYRDETNNFHPVVYFDNETSFEFHFTKFQGDWSDQSQISRFAQQLLLIDNQKSQPLN